MNPLSFLAYALAAGKGRVDGVLASAWAAAGFTLLQRSAPLVRAMAGRRSGIFLPPSGAVVSALAASDGRGALLLPTVVPPEELSWWLDQYDVGAVFTTRAWAERLPETARAIVLLDDAPRSATVLTPGAEQRIDLGSHFGLELEGEETDGSLDECVISTTGGGVTFSHRAMFALARGAVDATSLIDRDRVLAVQPASALAEFSLTIAGPLLAGAEVLTLPVFDAIEAVERLRGERITVMAADAAAYNAMLGALEDRAPLRGIPLRVCTCVGARPDAALQKRWLAATGVELRHAFGVAELPLLLYNAPHFPNRPGSLGVPFPAVHAEVRGGKSPPEDGVLWAQGAARGVARESGHGAHAAYDAAGATAAAESWFNTGVAARARADGAFDLSE